MNEEKFINIKTLKLYIDYLRKSITNAEMGLAKERKRYNAICRDIDSLIREEQEEELDFQKRKEELISEKHNINILMEQCTCYIERTNDIIKDFHLYFM